MAQKKLRRRLLGVLFLACLHILCPLRNAITPPKTMSLKSSGWTLTLKQGMCGVGSSIDFPKPKLQGLNYYGWGLRCVDHSKTITVKDQECLKQKNDLSISESCRRTALTNGSQLSWPNTNNPRRRKGQKKRSFSGAGSWLSCLWDIAWLTSCASTPAKPGRSLFEEARRRRKIGLSRCLAGQVAIVKHQL